MFIIIDCSAKMLEKIKAIFLKIVTDKWRHRYLNNIMYNYDTYQDGGGICPKTENSSSRNYVIFQNICSYTVSQRNLRR